MLSISHVRRGEDGRKYYQQLSKEDYYLKRGQEPPGEWYGRGAVRLGLFDRVDSESFTRLFDGYSPSGEPLTQSTGRKDRRPGFDLTFSAPKDVSVAWSQADHEMQQKIRAEVMGAVRTALRFVEEESAFTRLGKDGQTREQAKEITAALFQHAISRELDPQLHVHALVFNHTTASDGRTRTLDGQELYRVKMTAGALFRADLAARMERLGFGVERDGFAFKIEGIGEGIKEEFSKRSETIREQLGDRADASARQKERATLESREPKRDVDREKLMLEWRAVGLAHGLDAAKVRQLADHSHQERNHQAETKAAISEALRRLVGPENSEDWRKPEHERTPRHGRALGQSSFTRNQLIQFVAEEAQGRGLDATDVRQAVWQHLETSREIVRLGIDAEGQERFTSRELHTLEQDLIAKADRMKAQTSHRVSERAFTEALAARSTIKAEQEQAVRYLTDHRSGNVAALIGWAGTGKTFTLNTVREVFERSGYAVYGAATAGKAAKEMQDEAGIESTTIAKLLWDMEHKPQASKLGSKSVLIIDEAGMVGTRPLHRLISEAERVGAKVILVGDDKQLQAIDAGGGLAGLSKRFGYAELKEITRQKTAEDRAAVYDLASGDRERIAQAIRGFAARGKLRSEEDREQTMRRLVGDWTRDDAGHREKLILTSTNAQARTLNQMIQAQRLRANELKAASVKVGEERIHLGDRVIFTKRQKAWKERPAIENGMLGTAVALDPIRNRLTVRVEGKQGDKTITVDLGEYKSLKLGYAVTTHKAQGATVDSSYIFLCGNMTDAQAGYVQASRHRKDCKLYVSRDDAGEGFEDLIADMSRDRRKTLALDTAKEEPKIPASPEPMPTRAAPPQERPEPIRQAKEPQPAARPERGISIKLTP